MTKPRDQGNVSAAGILSVEETTTFDTTSVVNGVLTVTTRAAPYVDRTYVQDGQLTAVGGVANEIVTFAGDSRTDQAFDLSTGRFYLEARGAAAWALPASGHRFRFNSTEYGVGGDTTADLLARWSTVLADSAGTIVLLIGTNDRGSAAMTLQQSIDNVTDMLDDALAAGKAVVLGNEMPRYSSNALAGQQLQNHLDFHAWLDLAPSRWRNVYGWDTWSQISSDADTVDGLHPGIGGARKMGTALATVLSQVLPAIDYSRPYVPGESHAQPVLNANPDMTGTSGSKGTGITGNLATSFTAALSSTASAAGTLVACTKETISDVEYQVFTISGTTGAGTNTLTLRPTTDLTLTNGDSYDVRAKVILEASSSNVLSVTPEVRIDIGGTLTQRRALDGYTSPEFMPSDGFDLLLCTTPATIPPGTITSARGQLVVTLNPSSTVSAVVKIAQFAIRETA